MPKETVYKPIAKIKEITQSILSPKFMPTYYEWLFRGAEQIIRAERTNTNKILYTVPANKILYIISCYSTQDTTDSAYSVLYIDSDLNKPLIEFRAGSQTDNSVTAVSYNFMIPIILREKQKIGMYVQGITVMISAGFVGFLIDKRKIPEF